MISKKVILTGSFGVGKTSLFNCFIHQQFSEKYMTTVGVRVNKKTLNVDQNDITLMLWDIAGERAKAGAKATRHDDGFHQSVVME